MPVMIRLSRQGAKKNPFYHLVAIDKYSRRDGEFLEKLGTFDPSKKTAKEQLKLNLEAIENWKKKGAQFSLTVSQLLKKFSKV